MKLTLPQQDVYFEQLLYPNEPIYNIGAKIKIEGKIEIHSMKEAYEILINQHDAYRGSISKETGNISFIIADTHETSLKVIDFSDEEKADEKANNFMQEEFQKPFEFLKDKLLHNFILLKVSEEKHYLFSVYHHIITDGWGTSLMFQRLVSNYNELISYGKVTTEYPYTYTDFAENDDEYYQSEAYEKDKNYWKEKFKILPERLFQTIRETDASNKSDRKRLVIPRKAYDELIEISKQSRSSVFHVILGLLYLYLGKRYNQQDISIGVPVLNRSNAAFKRTVGLFMGVTALRMQLGFQSTFIELLQEIRQQLRQDYRYQRFPLGKLVKELDAYQEKDRLFNLTLSYEKQDYATNFLNTKTQVIPLSHKSERVALAIYVREFDSTKDVILDFDYNINYFEEHLIDSFVTGVENLMHQIIKEPNRKLCEYHYIKTQEKQELLYDFNNTAFQYSEKETVLSYIEKQAKKTPNAIALKDKEHTYTYKEVEALSNSAMQHILKTGIGVGEPVAMLMPRSAKLIIGILAIMKSGRPYIPLDPKFPVNRLNHIVEHSKVPLIISDKTHATYLGKSNSILDDLFVNDTEMHQTNVAIEGDNSAYIIYTSGSTGNPKGVEINHNALLNFLIGMQKSPGIYKEDVLLSVTTQSFDISILEFFVPLICGGTTYIVTDDVLENPFEVIRTINSVQPTVMQATPSFYQMLFNAGWTGNKTLKILCGGDLLSETLADKLIKTCSEVWNMYGPTETTIWSTCKRVVEAEQSSNIGTPIQNTQIYILDNELSLVPKYAPGIIYIGGKGLAKGYYRNLEMTQERFIKNPFNKGEIIYNTGDLGKWNEEKEIIFLGRNDNQVKIRGYRIELGDIETKLNAIETVKSSVVVAKKRGDQEAFLVAYVQKENEEFNSKEVLNTLSSQLPKYMIPYAITLVDEFPLTPNKKVDRKALSTQKLNEKSYDAELFIQPSSNLEIRLSKIYEDVLKLERNIGLNENFFELGGHSLNAVKLINKIEKEFQNTLSLKTIFDKPTLQEVARYLTTNTQKSHRKIVVQEKKPYYPITSPQYAIWIASLAPEKSIAYNMFAAYAIEGKIDKETLHYAFLKTINKFEILRTNFIEVNGVACQKVLDIQDVAFKIDEFETSVAASKNKLREYVNSEFDLENELLFKVGLFKDEEGKETLVFAAHHLIMDGWSLEVLIKEIAQYYKAAFDKKNVHEEKLNFQFKDFVAWQNTVQANNEERNSQYWSNYLADYSWNNLIPYDKEYSNKEYTGSFYLFDWNLNLLEPLNKLVLKQKVSLHSLLVVAFNVLLHKLYEHTDICVGTINSGRVFSELNDHIGMFVKTLPLRTKINENQSFSELLRETHDNILVIDEHQDMSQTIMNELRLEAIIVLQNQTYDYDNIYLSETVTVRRYPIDAKYNRLPLLIDFSVNENFFHGSIYYDTEKYNSETIALLVLKLEILLKEVVENPDVLIKDINIDLDFEKEKIIDIDFNF
ncbi:amino acid adenylation domain-containing protein [Kordia sp. YSTF-M3]|uniref:Amino acid adenylation domain-containing protein n=1 Tax=Kordia aestuariivivens TaxID=2759037 RepID=A0ABR7QEY7_9FLAO|nr:non-ribosomal peptide synthetase [Kordia aestuariivivens]MBC8756859.1 amino acid adenylation domain-containing protein [Kordia aestuariivivens]